MCDTVLLTDEDIANWKAERTRIEDAITNLKKALKDINHKIWAAYSLTPDAATHEYVPISITLAAMIVKVLEESPEPLAASGIKVRLRQMGIQNPSLDAGYFYTLLKKLVKEEKIERNGNIYSYIKRLTGRVQVDV